MARSHKRVQSKKQKQEALSTMNKDSRKPLRVRFCPQCRATNVGFVFRMKNLFGLLPRVECYECGHFGHEFPILLVTKESLTKKSSSKKSTRTKKKSVRSKTQKSTKKNRTVGKKQSQLKLRPSTR